MGDIVERMSEAIIPDCPCLACARLKEATKEIEQLRAENERLSTDLDACLKPRIDAAAAEREACLKVDVSDPGETVRSNDFNNGYQTALARYREAIRKRGEG